MTAKPKNAQQMDKHLIARAVNGDSFAIEQILSTYQGLVYTICLRMTSNRDDAAELTQDVLLKVCTKLDSFNQQSSLKTWITRIAMNASISHLRKRKLRDTTSLETTVSGPDDQAGELKRLIAENRELTPDQRVSKNEQLTKMMQKLETLDPELRSVLILRDLEGQDYQQIADSLEIPIGTVKSRLFRARVALREEMEKLGYVHAT